MTEEELEAIEFIKSIININKENERTTAMLYVSDVDILLNLIEKLEKENKELKNKVIKRDNELIDLEETSEKEFLTKQEVKDNYIPKDKIREKLERLESQKENYKEQPLIYMLLKNQLKSLIEEE